MVENSHEAPYDLVETEWGTKGELNYNVLSLPNTPMSSRPATASSERISTSPSIENRGSENRRFDDRGEGPLDSGSLTSLDSTIPDAVLVRRPTLTRGENDPNVEGLRPGFAVAEQHVPMARVGEENIPGATEGKAGST